MRKIVFWGIVCLMVFSGDIAPANETVLFGINVPLSGAYSKQGEDQLKAYKLAISTLNKKGGVLGKKIVYSVMDTQTNADTARENTVALIKEGAIMITGGSSSAVAIAQSEECQKSGVVFMAALTHSNATTGENAHRHTFRWYNNGHQTAQAMARTLISKYGENAKYAFLYSDYTWGITLQQSMQRVIEKAGGSTVLNLATKLGQKSYLAELLKVKKAKPDVLVLVHFGADMVNSLKQASKMKIRSQMEVVVPLMELHMAHEAGPEIMQGIITSMTWYHGLSEKFEGSAEFVRMFEQEYGKKPGNSAAVAWVDISQYADAVERAGTFDHIKVIKALEGHKFTLLGEEEYWRDWDHQGIHPTYVAVGKTPEESKNEWDLFKIIDFQKGEDVARTKEENPVTLEPLE